MCVCTTDHLSMLWNDMLLQDHCWTCWSRAMSCLPTESKHWQLNTFEIKTSYILHTGYPYILCYQLMVQVNAYAENQQRCLSSISEPIDLNTNNPYSNNIHACKVQKINDLLYWKLADTSATHQYKDNVQNTCTHTAPIYLHHDTQCTHYIDIGQCTDET